MILGGRLHDYVGRYPGVIEEALLSAEAGCALYVVGGFGGCGAALASHLRGSGVRELTQAWQLEHTPAANELSHLLSGSAYHMALERELAAKLPRRRWDVLNNQLSVEENVRLGRTTDSDEVIALVMAGLRRLVPRSTTTDSESSR